MVTKQSKRLNGDLEPEHKKNTNSTTMGPPQTLIAWEPSFSWSTDP